MIVWLASFPKSGNTWLRSLLSDYKNYEDNYSFERTIYSIKQFPSDHLFDFLFNEGIVKDRSLFQSLEYSSKYWLTAQRRLMFENPDDIILKTHGAPFRIKENYFLTKETTKCAICIIRDPRQVLFSLMKHYHFDSQEVAMQFLFENNRVLENTNDKTRKDNKFSHLPLPPWDTYYYSWIAYKNIFPILFVKYEDMFKLDTFNKIVKFLEKNSNDKSFIFDQEKTKNVFERSSFEKLKDREKNQGFKESTNNVSGFFNEGKIDSWKEKIDKKIKVSIEEKFGKLMREFNYL